MSSSDQVRSPYCFRHRRLIRLHGALSAFGLASSGGVVCVRDNPLVFKNDMRESRLD